MMSIVGIADGPKLSSNLAGEVIWTDFRKVMYFESALANVLSFDLAADMYLINGDQSKRQFFFRTEQGNKFTFKRRGALFVCDFSFLLERQVSCPDEHKAPTAFITSVKNNELIYSPRKIALLSRTLLRRLTFGQPAVIARMLKQRKLIECPITSDDKVTGDKIHGKFFPELRGKAVRRSGLDTISVNPSAPRVPVRLNMCTDIMFVRSKLFLLSLFQPINLTMVSNMGGSHALPNIRASLDTHLNLLEENGLFKVSDVYCEFDEDVVRMSIRTRPEARIV